MATHHHIGDSLFYLRHVAGHALVAADACWVVSVLFDAGDAVRAVGRIRAMTLQAHHTGRLEQVGVVRCSMNIVATEAGHAARIHQTVHKIVALHPILVRGTIGEVRERRLAQLMILQLPVIVELEAGPITDRPIVILAGDGVL